MEKKSGGMNIRLKSEVFNYFKECGATSGVGVAKLMVEVLENYYKQNILKKGETNDSGNIQEVPERPV